jgi:hypothetical protein
MCDTKLNVEKYGFGQVSSIVFGIPCGLIGAVLVVKYWNPDHTEFLDRISEYLTIPTFVLAGVGTIALDYLVDARFVYLRCCDANNHSFGKESIHVGDSTTNYTVRHFTPIARYLFESQQKGFRSVLLHDSAIILFGLAIVHLPVSFLVGVAILAEHDLSELTREVLGMELVLLILFCIVYFSTLLLRARDHFMPPSATKGTEQRLSSSNKV